MTTQYLDYELELGPASGADQWPLTVIQSPAGQARGVLSLPAAPEQLAAQAQAASPQQAQDLGRMLFDRLLRNSGIEGSYMESLGVADARGLALRVKLRVVDPRLALAPWELLYEDRFGEFTALSHETPIVRYAEAAQPQMPLAVKPPLRILGVAASPRNLPPIDLHAQQQGVETALAGLVRSGLVELSWLPEGTWRSLQQTLRAGGPWHILHFVGHGAVHPATGEGVLAFAGDDGAADLFSASELGRILNSHKPLRLALLNACHSGAGNVGNLYASVAATLIRRGLPAVIAMQFAILDTAGVELARTFYAALADGLPVEAALTDARIAVSFTHRTTLDWAAPVLYLRAPDGVLFALENGGGQAARSQTTAAATTTAPATTTAAAAPRLVIAGEIRELKGSQLQAAMNAIGAAYATNAALEQMVAVHLKENLAAIVGNGSLNNMIFDLLRWAQMRGRLTELLQGAIDGNPRSPELRAFIESLPPAAA